MPEKLILYYILIILFLRYINNKINMYENVLSIKL